MGFTILFSYRYIKYFNHVHPIFPLSFALHFLTGSHPPTVPILHFYHSFSFFRIEMFAASAWPMHETVNKYNDDDCNDGDGDYQGNKSY
jgi:hypothetical protein